MQQHIQTLVKQIFRKDDLKDVTVNELEQFTASFPYAAVGQFLLARKLKETGSEQFTHQADKASLYFNNPLWAHWQLQQQATAVTEPAPVLPIVTQRAEVLVHHEPVVSVVSLAEEAVEQQEVPPIAIPEADVTIGQEQPEITHSTETAEVADVQPEEAAEASLPETEAITETIEPAAGSPVTYSNHTLPPAEEDDYEPGEEEDDTNAPPLPPLLQATGTPMQTVQAPEEDLFEPYHTIDYFASQGIKLSKEDTDTIQGTLDRQLKSFTEWLRSMKRIAPVVVAAERELDDTTNQSIVQIAEHSVSGNEIVTEAMAEVWAKQGNLPQAIAIYEKLSLQNPAKNAYFAARIQEVIAQKPD